MYKLVSTLTTQHNLLLRFGGHAQSSCCSPVFSFYTVMCVDEGQIPNIFILSANSFLCLLCTSAWFNHRAQIHPRGFMSFHFAPIPHSVLVLFVLLTWARNCTCSLLTLSIIIWHSIFWKLSLFCNSYSGKLESRYIVLLTSPLTVYSDFISPPQNKHRMLAGEEYTPFLADNRNYGLTKLFVTNYGAEPFLRRCQFCSYSKTAYYRVHKSSSLVPTLSQTIPQSIPLHPSYLRSILILSTHLHLHLPSGLFNSDFPTNNPNAFIFSII